MADRSTDIRTFRAVAMPNGDARAGLEGPMVQIIEYLKVEKRRGVFAVRVLTIAEAAQLRDALDAALAAPALARELAAGIATELSERPRAYTGPYHIHGGTLAEVGF